MPLPTFYIIDAMAAIYRAYHAIRPLSTSTGLPTHAIFGFIQIVLKIAKEADYLAVAFDTPGPTFRHAAYAGYKIDRPPMPDDLSRQIPYIYRMVAALQIQTVTLEGFEADDLIGTLAARGEAAGWDVAIVSGDKDMHQLVTPHVRVFDPMKGKWYDEAAVREKWGVSPSQVADILGLMGDASDQIPGVTGIGPKTASKLIAEFGSVEKVLAAAETLTKPALQKALKDEAETARLSLALAKIDTACPIPFEPNRFLKKDFDPILWPALCRELEFTRLLQTSTPIPVMTRPPTALPSVATLTVTALSAADLPAFTESVRESRRVALVPDVDEATSEWRGIGMATKAGTPFYLSFSPDDPIFPPALAGILASREIVKVGHDVKPQIATYLQKGMAATSFWDTMIAAYLLQPDRRDYRFETVVEAALNPTAPVDTTEPMSPGRRAEILLQVADLLEPKLEAAGMMPLFTEIEMPLVAVLADMERHGVGIDVAQMGAMSAEIHAQRAVLTTHIHQLAGGEFNVASSRQLGEILFNKLGLPRLRKTKTGHSTDEETLTHLATLHPLPAAILEERQLTKLASTYVDVFPKMASAGRIYTQLRQTTAATGRLSSTDPNLQNIPVRGEWGRRIRQTFIAAPGGLLLSADYNQIELRILAHLSCDRSLIESFHRGDDIHLQTAAQIFGLPTTSITTEMRRAAKSVNFGIIYGISPFGLANGLGVSQAEAKRYIDAYFDHYPRVAAFLQNTVEAAAHQGYVTTLFGRRRTIAGAGIESPQMPARPLRGGEGRIAVNTVVQGSAADIIKRAMIAIHNWTGEQGVKSRMILQVHDELIFDVPNEERELMRENVRLLMERAATLSVPLVAEVGLGANWAEAH
jgi:DNA polymerase-1